MANAVPFQLITPRNVAFDGEAELVIAVGTEGEIGIMPSHAPLLTALRPGVLRANVRPSTALGTGAEGGETKRLELATGDGFLQAMPGKITVLTDVALTGDAVDVGATRRELATAQDEQKAAGSDLVAWRRAQNKIDFAHAKLKIVGVT